MGCGGILPEAHQRDIDSPVRSRHGGAKALEANAQLASYNAYLRHVLANQQKLRRDSEYDRSDWPNTVKALSNGPPATVADLHALLLDQLDDLRQRIARENTDIYRWFWNRDRYARHGSSSQEEKKKRAAAKKTPKRKGVTAAARKAAKKKVPLLRQPSRGARGDHVVIGERMSSQAAANDFRRRHQPHHAPRGLATIDGALDPALRLQIKRSGNSNTFRARSRTFQRPDRSRPEGT